MMDEIKSHAKAGPRSGAPSTNPPRSARRSRRAFLLWAGAVSLFCAFIAAAVAPSPARAAASAMTLVCPSDGVGDPYLQASGNRTVAITDATVKALAVQSCAAGAAGNQSTSIRIVNNRNVSIYVGFTAKVSDKIHMPGPIVWGAGCVLLQAGGAMVIPGGTCSATVRSTGQESRFCAVVTYPAPSDCFNAQANQQTMIETNFEPSTNGGCFGQGNCVWYDISVIPSSCTDEDWQQNQCAGTGGASYNLPVQLSCNGVPTYTCQGPPSGAYGSANYPSNCGNPNATCNGSPQQSCKNAYFYPDPPNQPNTGCYGGRNSIFTVTFLAGS